MSRYDLLEELTGRRPGGPAAEGPAAVGTARLVAAVALPLEPVAASRPRVTRSGRTYTAEPYASWRRAAAATLASWWGRRAPIAVPVLVDTVSVIRRPSRAVRHYTIDGTRHPYPWPWGPGRRPALAGGDEDNLRKAVLDALVSAGVLADDVLVLGPIRGGIVRWYAAAGEDPRTEIRIATVS